jgi:hypothetical protein
MPYQVEQLLEGKGPLVWVTKDDTVKQALSLMLEHDYSQLPVLNKNPDFDAAEGMVTYEAIIRGIRNFNLSIDVLRVRDVMGRIFICNGDDDLFDILDRLKETNAALVMNKDEPIVEGIITTYDTTEYFRARTEDLMRVEEVETTIRSLIQEAYTTISPLGQDDTIDIERLNKSARAVSYGKPKAFDQLSFSEYINLLTYNETWKFFEPIFNIPIDSVKNLLSSVRETRNLLAHFRGDLSSEERDRLKFTVEWINRCHEEYQKSKEQKKIELMHTKLDRVEQHSVPSDPRDIEFSPELFKRMTEPLTYVVTESTKGGGRYAALADYLQSQPGGIDQVHLTFNEIEAIIGGNLPDSARVFRAWWSNDSVGHSQSQLWLAAGWRTTYVNLSEGKVTFSRIREREKAYISFFSKLLDDLRKNHFPVRDVSPDGASWIVLQPIPRNGPSYGDFIFSFSRDRRLRVELYLDLLDKEKTKAAFDQLYAQKNQFESQVGDIEWERLDNRRASRLALYREGQITDEAGHTELRKWAVDAMIKFYNTMLEPAEKAIQEAMKNTA